MVVVMVAVVGGSSGGDGFGGDGFGGDGGGGGGDGDGAGPSTRANRQTDRHTDTLRRSQQDLHYFFYIKLSYTRTFLTF